MTLVGQVALIQRHANKRGWSDLEISTVDRFQGRDKAAVLFTLVRSNEAGSAGRLLADWRRINVAITRAKQKLVFVGSADTLAEVPMFAELVGWVRRQNLIEHVCAPCLA